MNTELERDSRSKGLALVSVVDQKTVVIPFGDRERYYVSKWPLTIATFSKSGRVIAWNIRPFMALPEIQIEGIGGEQIAGKTLRSDLSLQSINEECKRLVFVAASGKDRPETFDLRWSLMHFSDDRLLDRFQRGDFHGVDLSRDCRSLVFGKGEAISVLDAEARTSVVLGKGYDPAWSPDGKTIVFRATIFRATNGTVSLMSGSGSVVPSPLNSHTALTAIRWSPDGKYVGFIEKIAHQPFVYGPTSRLEVCRVQDGSCLAVRWFGVLRGYYEFSWIIDYKAFCRGCTPGAPFG